jgi:hypothetical protein
MADEWPELDWPGMRDDGRVVELLLPDGRRIVGRLIFWTTEPGGDAEIPVFMVGTLAGTKYRLDEAAAWRWIEP